MTIQWNMIGKRSLRGAAAGIITILLPSLGNPLAYARPQLWILFVLGIFCSFTQPSLPSKKETHSPDSDFDRRSAQQIFFVIWITQLWAVCEAVYLRFPESFFWTGFTTAALITDLLGIGLRAWAVHELGRFFSWKIQVRSDQRVICTGPYRFVRHPSYTGAVIAYLSAIAFLQAWYTFAAAAVLYVAVYLRRIKLEEKMLQQALGLPYKEYQNRVKALIPYVL